MALAEAEFQTYRGAHRVERDNLRAAYAHAAFELFVINALLRERAKFAGDDALFGTVIEEVGALYQEREVIRVIQLPATLLRELAPYLLFDVQLPQLGQDASAPVPRVLAYAAIDAAKRVVDAAKIRKSEQYVNRMITRIQRTAEDKAAKSLRL